MYTITEDRDIMIRSIKTYMEQNNMLTRGDRIVVGVSGGADSICLLHVLKQLSQEYELYLIAVHINHGIRGEEASRDERFVRDLCLSEGLEFRSIAVDVRDIAKKDGLSEEEAGRKVRYETFFEVCREMRCNKIAIAHNRNDNAETVLFNLFRGSGIRGLSGIEPNRVFRLDFGEVSLIRPLLSTERYRIEEFLRLEGIPYQTDSTNLEDHYSRNKIRNRILAYATQEINQQSVNNISEAAASLREIGDYLNSCVARCYQELVVREEQVYRIPVVKLTKEHTVIQKGILRLVMERIAGGSKDLEAKHAVAALALLNKQVGKQVHLPYNITIERGYEDIIFFQKKPLLETPPLHKSELPVPLKIPGRTELVQVGKYVETELISYKNSDPIPKSSCAKWFDYDKIENTVEIRTRREGDYLQINEFGGRKKLKDYFIDHKIPQKMRDSQLLFTDGSHVMWIPGIGERMSERYKVDAATTKVLLIKMFDMEVKKDGAQN
jgi:tRNA(Ile)-lysidine synthase